MPPKGGKAVQPVRIEATGNLAVMLRRMLTPPGSSTSSSASQQSQAQEGPGGGKTQPLAPQTAQEKRALASSRGSSSSPTQAKQQDRQVKPRVQEDGMELALVLAEPDQAPMQTESADEGTIQPCQQNTQLALVPFSPGESTAPGCATQNEAVAADRAAILAALDSVDDFLQQDRQQRKQREAECKEMKTALLARLSSLPPVHAPPMQPTTQPAAQQPPKQPSAQPSKQPAQQTSKQPAKRPAAARPAAAAPRFSEVVAATCGAMTAAAVSALLPPSQQTRPQAQQSQWQQQNHKRSAQHQQQKQPRQGGQAVGVDRFAHLCHFTVSGSSLDTSGTASQVVQRVVGRVEGGAGVTVVDAVRLGPAASPRFHFKVATVEQADTLVRGRGKALAATGIVLSELLSAAESALHAQLYPDFLRLKAAGHKVQFRRARLFVDGQLWSRAGGAAAA